MRFSTVGLEILVCFQLLSHHAFAATLVITKNQDIPCKIKVIDMFTNQNTTKPQQSNMTNATMRSPRFRRSPLGSRSKCTASIESVSGIVKSVDAALAGKSSQLAVTCDFIYNKTNANCNELFKLLQCGMQHLILAYNLAVDNLNAEKNILDELHEQLNKAIDATNQEMSETHQRQLQQLEDQIQTLVFRLDKLETQAVASCISEIENGDYVHAADIFKSLDVDKGFLVLPQIIRKAYNKEHLNAHNILSFIKKLPTCKQDNIAYPVIYNLLKDNNQVWGSELFRIDADIEQCGNHTDTQKEVSAQAIVLQKDWALRIPSNYWREELHKQVGNFKYILKHWPEIVKFAYMDFNSVDNLIDFANKAMYHEDRVTILLAIYDQLEAHNDLLEFNGWKILEIVERSLNQLKAEETRQKYIQLREKLEDKSGCKGFRYVGYGESSQAPTAAYDLDGEIIQSCRIYTDGNIVPGFRPTQFSPNSCYVAINGKYYKGSGNVEVLTIPSGARLNWNRTSSLPSNAFVGGRTNDGETLYVARCKQISYGQSDWMPAYFQSSAGALSNPLGICKNDIEFLVC